MPKYSRKDYELVAEVLHESKNKEQARKFFSDVFEEDNPKFDRNKFNEALRTGKTKGMKTRVDFVTAESGAKRAKLRSMS